MRINPFIYGILVLGIFLGTINIFKAAGVWSTSGKITSDGKAVTPDTADVNTIKGWMTLDVIVSTYQVPLPDLLAQFNLPADTPPTTALKDLESDTFDVTLLREWLQTRIGTGGTASPADTPVATEPPVAPTLVQPQATQPPVPAATEHVAPARAITGKTTFQEVLDWGVPQAAIEQIIGGNLPSPSMVIKDYVVGQGKEFSSIKAALQAEVDKTK